jgi:hypothetical protein
VGQPNCFCSSGKTDRVCLLCARIAPHKGVGSLIAAITKN